MEGQGGAGSALGWWVCGGSASGLAGHWRREERGESVQGGGVIYGVIAGLGVVNKSCNFCWQKLNFLLSA
jgi:hypothetical protein